MKKSIALAAALLAVTGVARADRTGEEIFSLKCFVCHNTGAAGAPKVGDKEAWAPRIATGEEALMKSVMNGKNAMPPKGACMDCTDGELKAAMEYIISKAK